MTDVECDTLKFTNNNNMNNTKTNQYIIENLTLKIN